MTSGAAHPSAVEEALGRGRVIPVLRSASTALLAEQVQALAAAGIQSIEVTTVTPGWDGALPELQAAHGSVTFGVGTVTTARDAEAAVRAGASFLVSPWAVPAVRAVATRAGLLLIEGGFTPGEVAAAALHGAAKVFPASVGGPDYVRALRAVMPGARLIPTGGIALDEVADYLAAGAFAVGVGSALANVDDLGSRLQEVMERSW